MKQLEDFSRKVYVPFGYLFLQTPPTETLPIPFFRSEGGNTSININVYDTILLLQQRQEWLRGYLTDNDYPELPFVGKYANIRHVPEIVKDMRDTLGLRENWAADFKTWEEALKHLSASIESVGIVPVFNGVVENNTHRVIPVEECRGFVLVDRYAPFMFINNADFKAAQMFTVVHELAHIWTGHSAGFDFRKIQPAPNATELLCDRIAAEFLVPADAFNLVWQKYPDVKYLSGHFKVSEIVIARRALDTGKWNRETFITFYNAYKHRAFLKKEAQVTSGGDFYATARKRLSTIYVTHIKNAVTSSKLLYRDAYKLTGMKGDTFEKFFSAL